MSWELKQFKGRHVFMIGAGREGKGMMRFVEGHDLGNTAITLLDQGDGADYLDVAVRMPDEKRIIVKSSGVPPSALGGVEYVTPSELFFDIARQCEVPIVGVTGTKGKSTTASLLSAILKEAGIRHVFGGNIGIPMLDLIDNFEPSTVAVIELSSFMLNELRVSPHVSIVTNMLEDHLDVHGSVEAYHEAKRNIVRFQKAGDLAITLATNAMVVGWVRETPARLLVIEEPEWQATQSRTLLGTHNQQIAALAVRAAESLGAPPSAVERVLETFLPLPHRLEIVTSKHDITYINDAIASQPSAAVAGILAARDRFGSVGGVIVGGVARGVDLTVLANVLTEVQPRAVAFISETGRVLEALVRDRLAGFGAYYSDLGQAVRWLEGHCLSGDVIILSPGAPCYSLSAGRRTNSKWQSYEELGEAFRALVT